MELTWIFSQAEVDWQALSGLYVAAGMGHKAPADIQTAFTHSLFKCFVYDAGRLVAVGRALADGFDASYICDIAVHPDYQGQGIGKQVVLRLVEFSKGHRKILLYAAPGKEAFYRKLGFQRMRTAMAIFQNQVQAVEAGLLEGES